MLRSRLIRRPGRTGLSLLALGFTVVVLAACGSGSPTAGAAGTSVDLASARSIGGTEVAAANPCNPCNPCAKKANACNPCNPCANNPCAKKGNPCNPCGMKHNACNPCGGANPCNPCGGAPIDPASFSQPAGARLASGSRTSLVARGEQLWNDRSLGKTGLACASCHIGKYMQMQPSFGQPYPHRVAMPLQRAGVEQVNAAEMVQFCMVVPMATEPLAWNSQELASLTAYVESMQAGYRPVAGAANPCNPCGANPCNPCAKHNACNPCGAKHNACNPCAMKHNACNPCGAANACNPCARKSNPCARR